MTFFFFGWVRERAGSAENLKKGLKGVKRGYGGQKWNLRKKSFKISTTFILFGDLIAPKTRIINIINFHFGGTKTTNIDQRRKIFKCFKLKIKHTSNRNFQLKKVPLDARRFKLFKYMCFCPKRSFVASAGGRIVGSRLKIFRYF